MGFHIPESALDVKLEIASRANLFLVAMLAWNWKEWTSVFGPVIWIEEDEDSLRTEVRDGQDVFLWALVGVDDGSYLEPGVSAYLGTHRSIVKAAKSRAEAGWQPKWVPAWRLLGLHGVTMELPIEVPVMTAWVGCEECASSGNEGDCPHTEHGGHGTWVAIDEIDLDDGSFENLCWDVSADSTLGPLACIAAGVLLRLFLKPRAATDDIKTVTEKALAIRDSLSGAEQEIVDEDLMFRAGILDDSVADNPAQPVSAETSPPGARPGSPAWREQALEVYSGNPWAIPFFFESCKGAEFLSSIFARLSPLPEMVQWFTKAPSEHIRRAAAGNPHIPKETLFSLAHDDSELVRGGVGLNPSSPLELLMQIAEDSASWPRTCVAGNPALPGEVITKLLSDDDPTIRTELAKNPRVPVEILELMSDAVFVREGVAKNPSTPVRILLKLAASDDKQVRASVAQNPNLPRNTLLQLLADPRDIVRSGAAENPSLPLEILESLALNLASTPGLASALSRNPSTPATVLTQLEESRSLALHPNAPPELVDFLADHIDVDVRAAAMQNPNAAAATFVRVFGNLAAKDN